VRFSRWTGGLALALGLVFAGPLAARTPGKLLGIVVANGAPQLGATVVLTPEETERTRLVRLVSNDRGVFENASLPAGLYAVRIELAGFLPAVRHVQILPGRTMLLRVELDSGLASLDRLRGGPAAKGSDDWGWVLRTSAATRPILRWEDGQIVVGEEATAAEREKKRTRGRVEMTAGAVRPGSVAGSASSPATAFVYDQAIGTVSDLLLAGQVSYDHAAAAGFSATWLPEGKTAAGGPATTVVVRQAKLGPDGPTFRAMRLEQDEQVAFGDHLVVQYGGDLVAEGTGPMAVAARPHVKASLRLAKAWQASLAVETAPPQDRSLVDDSLESALTQLDAFPIFLVRDGRAVMATGWHEELAVEHSLGPNTRIIVAAFRDQSAHTAVFGRGPASDQNLNFVQDFFSDAFAYDGGATADWGTRLAVERKLSRNFEAAMIYAWAGALSPAAQEADDDTDLRSFFQRGYHHCLGARVSGELPRSGTRFAASYLWVNGSIITAPDPYGEAAYGVEPYLNLSVRQPLPAFLCCRLEALADFRNVLAQGYVPLLMRDGQTLLMPAMRSFRGGVSVQF
jgi:Carboxypeptidase regulatory-like domain